MSLCSSWSEASRNGLEHRETDGRQDLLHEHVYRLGYGYGGDLRQRAGSCLDLSVVRYYTGVELFVIFYRFALYYVYFYEFPFI